MLKRLLSAQKGHEARHSIKHALYLFLGVGFIVYMAVSFFGGKDSPESILSAYSPGVKVYRISDTPLSGIRQYHTNRGVLLADLSAGVVIRGTLESLETGESLIDARTRPLPFAGVGGTPHYAQAHVRNALSAGIKGGEAAAAKGSEAVFSSAHSVASALKERLSSLRAKKDSPAEPQEPVATSEPRPKPQPAQSSRPDGAIPKIGFDNEGKSLGADAKRHQTAQLMDKLPKQWLLEYAADNPAQTITVFTDPSCPYCRRMHDAIPELNEAGISVRYIFYPRQLSAGHGNAAAQSLVSRINRAWCASDPHGAVDALFAGSASGGRDCSSLPANDQRPKNPAADHHSLGQIVGVTGTPYIVHESGEAWAGFSSAQDAVRRVREASAR